MIQPRHGYRKFCGHIACSLRASEASAGYFAFHGFHGRPRQTPILQRNASEMTQPRYPTADTFAFHRTQPHRRRTARKSLPSRRRVFEPCGLGNISAGWIDSLRWKGSEELEYARYPIDPRSDPRTGRSPGSPSIKRCATAIAACPADCVTAEPRRGLLCAYGSVKHHGVVLMRRSAPRNPTLRPGRMRPPPSRPSCPA